MHTIRRYDSPLERLSEALGAFLRRRAVEAGGIVLVSGSIAGALALATWSVNDPSWNNATSAPTRNLLGPPGAIGADLLIQIFGLGSVAFLLGPVAWGSRLLRQKRLERPVTRFLLWGAGIMACAATASALPPTTRWPLLTGLGGVVGDGVLGLRHLVGLSGATGAAIAGLGFAALAILALTAACSAGRRTPEVRAEEAPARRRRGEDRDHSSGDEEPSWFIITLGAIAHAAMTVKSALRRKVVANLEARRQDDEYASARPAPALERRPAPAVVSRREPSFSEAPAAVSRPAATRAPQPAIAERRPAAPPPDLDEDEDAPSAPVARGGRKIVVKPEYDDIEPELDDLDAFDDETSPRTSRAARRRQAGRSARPCCASSGPRLGSAAPMRQATTPQEEPAGDYDMPPLTLLAEAKKQVSTVSKDALEQNATCSNPRSRISACAARSSTFARARS
jgi:S-DNA-T family DNA segregation ATPase FtsK/SpoIIIE